MPSNPHRAAPFLIAKQYDVGHVVVELAPCHRTHIALPLFLIAKQYDVGHVVAELAAAAKEEVPIMRPRAEDCGLIYF